MKCPHCNKQDNNNLHHERAYRNAENYGSSTFTFQCSQCDKKYYVYFERQIRVGKAHPVLNTEDLSFPFPHLRP